MADESVSFVVEAKMLATPSAIYRAWTEEFDTWFASPGAIRMNPAIGEPFWFEVIHDGQHHAHYGRFLTLEPGVLIEQTWVTGKLGTEGAETVVRIDLAKSGSGSDLRLTHSGFFDTTSAKSHADAWPRILAHLDEVLTGSMPST